MMPYEISEFYEAWPYVLAIGALVGLVQSFLGLGGGVIIVPLLPLVFKMEPRQAVATSLLVLAPVSLINATRLFLRREIDLSLVFRIGPMAMLGSTLAAHFSKALDPAFVVGGFGVVTTWMAYQVFFKTIHHRRDFSQLWKFLMGLFAGIVSGVTGVSTGVILVPFLNRVRELDLARVVPTSIGIVALSATAAAVTFWVHQVSADGTADLFSWPMVALLAFAALASSQIGILYQAKVPQRIKLAILGTYLLTLSVRSFYLALS